MKDTIEIGKEFYVNAIKYTCVGHDDGFIWGVIDEHSESIPFNYYDCVQVSKFTIKQ